MVVARLEAARGLAAARGAHLVARILEVVGMDEVGRAVPDHVVRAKAENVLHAWADLDEIAKTVGDQDQVARGFEDALALFGLAAQLLARLFLLGDVMGDL